MSQINKYEKESMLIVNDTKKFTFSKLWLVITGIIFIVVIMCTFIISFFQIDVFDTTVYVSAITASGAIFGANLGWYAKKSTYENHYKLRMSMYRDLVNNRLYYNNEMMKLRKRYGLAAEDISEIEDSGEIDDIMESESSNDIEKSNSDRDEIENGSDYDKFNDVVNMI